MILDNTLDNTIKVLLTEKLNKLEESFSADVVFYFGELHPAMVRPFRDLIEDLRHISDARSEDEQITGTLSNSSKHSRRISGNSREDGGHYPSPLP